MRSNVDMRSKLALYLKEAKESPQPLKHKNGHDLEGRIPGFIQNNEQGSCYVIENRYPLSYVHGGLRLGDAAGVGGDVITALGGGSMEGVRADRLIYLDTETTGLSGGTGTVAFLVGTGFFDGEAFVVRQYFMRDYDEEAAMLTEFKRLFTYYQGFVTFNGKAFDINLLQSRFISNRFRLSLSDTPNLDLLYPARRVWGLKLDSCRLSSLEENVLGEFRNDDIPGAQIPSIYFSYLDDGDATQIIRVLKHNALDILSMVSLLIKLSVMMSSPLTETDGNYELLGLGKLFYAGGRTGDMLRCLEACTWSGHFSVKMMAVKLLTAVYKRNGDYERAMEHWRAVETENPGFELFHLIEMAKYYEHRAKDLTRAAQAVEKAVQNCLRAGLTGSRQFEELKKRGDRLRRKTLSAP